MATTMPDQHGCHTNKTTCYTPLAILYMPCYSKWAKTHQLHKNHFTPLKSYIWCYFYKKKIKIKKPTIVSQAITRKLKKTPYLPAFSNTNHTLETVSSENCTLLLPLHLQGLQRWWNQRLSQVPHAATFVHPMPISAISYRLVQHWTGLYYTQPRFISLFALWLRTSFY